MKIQVEISNDIPLNQVTLTVTAAYSRKERKILEIAAEKANFKKDAVHYLTEPEAAAIEWTRQIGGTKRSVRDLIVLDCGGGTLDIAYLHRSKAGIFQVIRDERGQLDPKGFRIGGCDIDEELLETIGNKLPAHLRQEVERESVLYRKAVRETKELFVDEEVIHPIRIGGNNVVLTETEIRDAIKDKFIEPACRRLASHVKAVKDFGRIPYLLLVGGGAKLKELAKTFKHEFKCEVISDCDRAEFATVLGASCLNQYEYGMENFKNQNYNAAITDFKRAIELNPLDRKAYTGLGQAYFYQGNTKFERKQYNAAITDYDEAIRINPEYDKAYYKRGNTKYALGDYKAAIDDYNAAIRINPEFADAYNNRGLVKCALGDYKAAIDDYNAAIRINPDQILAYHNRGIAKSSLEQYEAAIADYDAAIRINPEYHESHYSRGNAKRALGDYKAAIDDYNAAIRINPEFADAYNNRGLVKCALGDYKAAIDDYNAAIRINPDQILAYHNRGIAKEEILKPLSKKHPEVLRELEALSSILLKLTAKPKHPSVLQVLPLLLEHCVVNLSTEYLRSFHVDLKECEDVLFHNLRQYYLNTGERPFKFKNGELRLTSSVFWHSVVWGLEPMQFLNKIGEQLDEYSQRLIDFLTIPDLFRTSPGSVRT